MNLALKSVEWYKKTSTSLSFVFPSLVVHSSCKYHPTCSEYGAESIKKHGFMKGSIKTIWRIMRCNPWSQGGVDLP